MGGIFNLDNAFWRTISKAFDAVVLSFLYIIFCIPIVTIGASTTAFYYTLMKIAKDEEGYITKEFIKSFRQNFKQGTIIHIILSVIYAIIILDIFIMLRIANNTIEFIILYIFLFLIMIVNMLTLYIYPLLAKFSNTTKNLLRFSFILCIKHLGWTVFMFIIIGLASVISLIVPPLVLILPGIISLLNANIFNYIFERYIKDIEEKEEQENLKV